MLAIAIPLPLVSSCQGVLDPKGPIGAAQRTILFDATTIMLAVVIPVILITLSFAWWFRSGNTRARYLPEWSYSGRLELLVWSIPALIVLFLGGIAWIGSHDLDPPRPIGTKKPVEVQVVSLDWKWLFIYPDQNIASVNRLVVPVGRPVSFRLTSATVMNSFFVPQLGSQIYTMSGMTTRLHLQADHPGTYQGISAQFSGQGFSDMRFDVDAVDSQKFDEWVATVRGEPDSLDAKAYAALARPGTVLKPVSYSSVAPGLFDAIVQPSAHHGMSMPSGSAGNSEN